MTEWKPKRTEAIRYTLVRADGTTAPLRELRIYTTHYRHESPDPDIQGRMFAPPTHSVWYVLDDIDGELPLMPGEYIVDSRGAKIMADGSGEVPPPEGA